MERGLLEGATVGKDKIMISHLQYADDTVFACSGKSENLRTIKYILRNFELVSGLKVNFNKCCLMGINIASEMLGEMACYLGCDIGQQHMSYLGLNVGINH
ncbi:hypothetical protein ACS0TY_023510 [Phlomoides rotata]